MELNNTSVHRSIGMAPNAVNEDVEHGLWLKQKRMGPQKVTNREPASIFQVGDEVRLSKAKLVFAKAYLPNWTEEIFTVS